MRRTPARMCFVLFALLASPWAVAQVGIGTLDAAAKQRAPVQQPSLKQQSSPSMRSAQNDCVREANRRGFAVLDTGNFQQFREGWSLDMRVRDSRGRIQQGSCLVETRTGDVDLYGFGWGWDDGGDDRIEFNCSSVESKRRECQLPIDGRVRLIKQRSDSPCIEGRTWGQRGDRIWVDDGCRAKFEVTRRGGSGGGGSGDTIECSSNDGRYRECAIGPGRFGRLVREYSNGRCREDRTWGTRNGVIWVTDGCRARFEVRRGNGNGNGNGGGGAYLSADDAQRACRTEIERFGHKVREVSEPYQGGGEYRMTAKIRGISGEKRSVGCRVDARTGRVRLEW